MEHRACVAHDVLDAQHQHWEQTFAQTPEMFGDTPSEAARKAAEVFNKAGVTTILELGGGQGRDTIFFAQSGFHISVLDYTKSGVHAITKKAQALGLSPCITTMQHDVRTPLPFEDESFDACYSHTLYCMALTSRELEGLAAEVSRILKPNGLHMYTMRNTNDPHYGTGMHHGEDMYEVGGFIVHFLARPKSSSWQKAMRS